MCYTHILFKIAGYPQMMIPPVNYLQQGVYMKETIYTIPLNDAFHAEDECPFCYLERDAEQHALEFILGSQASYMEQDRLLPPPL